MFLEFEVNPNTTLVMNSFTTSFVLSPQYVGFQSFVKQINTSKHLKQSHPQKQCFSIKQHVVFLEALSFIFCPLSFSWLVFSLTVLLFPVFISSMVSELVHQRYVAKLRDLLWFAVFKRSTDLERFQAKRINHIIPNSSLPHTQSRVCTNDFSDLSTYIYIYRCFLKWWYPQNTLKWSCLVGKPMVVGYHHFRKPPYIYIPWTCMQPSFSNIS